MRVDRSELLRRSPGDSPGPLRPQAANGEPSKRPVGALKCNFTPHCVCLLALSEQASTVRAAHFKAPCCVANPSEMAEVVEELVHDRHRRPAQHCICVKVPINRKATREDKPNTGRRRYTPRGNVGVAVMISTPPLHPHP